MSGCGHCSAGSTATGCSWASCWHSTCPTCGYQVPEGTYLAWLDCRRLGLGDDPAAVFRERGRVALSPGPDFGTGGQGHARLNFATSPGDPHRGRGADGGRRP